MFPLTESHRANHVLPSNNKSAVLRHTASGSTRLSKQFIETSSRNCWHDGNHSTFQSKWYVIAWRARMIPVLAVDKCHFPNISIDHLNRQFNTGTETALNPVSAWRAIPRRWDFITINLCSPSGSICGEIAHTMRLGNHLWSNAWAVRFGSDWDL